MVGAEIGLDLLRLELIDLGEKGGGLGFVLAGSLVGGFLGAGGVLDGFGEVAAKKLDLVAGLREGALAAAADLFELAALFLESLLDPGALSTAG